MQTVIFTMCYKPLLDHSGTLEFFKIVGISYFVFSDVIYIHFQKLFHIYQSVISNLTFIQE